MKENFGAVETATGVYIRIDSRVVKHFLENVVAKDKSDVTIDFDGNVRNFTLEEFKDILFPTQKRALQALLIAGTKMRDEVLDGLKKITIREGHRNYTLGPVMIGCHLLSWATLRTITKIQWKLLKEVTDEEMFADGFISQDDMMAGLRQFYPNIGLDSPVTVVEWEYQNTSLVDKQRVT
jgi:hypothetical protein